eukprot:CAMPEP_0178425608 /NCGR_PEP_ID=MMETSP0689_2-20121128/28810_1 /TAXON_ID=160604 /ORGANISM="Amphidinium massartii, Strain CS-259" /LENGTH=306 /DNA_ID=CAMNT_0020047275 /DNA_START=174 /DNA_END=1091 /DNA_ORIENTATION=-
MMYSNRAFDYGSAGKPENLPDMEKPGAGLPLTGKSTRKRLNAVAILVATFAPWLMWILVCWCLSFQMHFNYGWLAMLIVAGMFLVVLAVAYQARNEFLSRTPKTWYSVIAVCLFLAWALGIAVGDFIYAVNTKRGFELQTLNSYPGVNPATQSGEEVMDAGRIIFAEGSRLDLSKSMGFKSGRVYCVAPVTLPGTETISYDYWAVGTSCCSGTQADFHCGAYNNPNAASGVRLMDDLSRPYYRLAVQQAEAMYGIRAEHPLFFEWVQDPVKVVQRFYEDGAKLFQIWMWCYFLLQSFLVVCACLYF